MDILVAFIIFKVSLVFCMQFCQYLVEAASSRCCWQPLFVPCLFLSQQHFLARTLNLCSPEQDSQICLFSLTSTFSCKSSSDYVLAPPNTRWFLQHHKLPWSMRYNPWCVTGFRKHYHDNCGKVYVTISLWPRLRLQDQGDRTEHWSDSQLSMLPWPLPSRGVLSPLLNNV